MKDARSAFGGRNRASEKPIDQTGANSVRILRDLALRRAVLRRCAAIGELGALSAHRTGDVLPRAASLDVGGIGTGHRAAQAEFGTVAVDPAPHGLVVAVSVDDIGGAAVAITADRARAAMKRVAGARLEARRDHLPIVVAERAQHRPPDAGGVHRLAGVIELLAEVTIHA